MKRKTFRNVGLNKTDIKKVNKKTVIHYSTMAYTHEMTTFKIRLWSQNGLIEIRGAQNKEEDKKKTVLRVDESEWLKEGGSERVGEGGSARVREWRREWESEWLSEGGSERGWVKEGMREWEWAKEGVRVNKCVKEGGIKRVSGWQSEWVGDRKLVNDGVSEWDSGWRREWVKVWVGEGRRVRVRGWRREWVSELREWTVHSQSDIKLLGVFLNVVC
jgi:hypothetical protein